MVNSTSVSELNINIMLEPSITRTSCLQFQCLHPLLVEAELETAPSDGEESSIPLVANSDYPQYVIVIVTLSQI